MDAQAEQKEEVRFLYARGGRVVLDMHNESLAFMQARWIAIGFHR